MVRDYTMQDAKFTILMTSEKALPYIIIIK